MGKGCYGCDLLCWIALPVNRIPADIPGTTIWA